MFQVDQVERRRRQPSLMAALCGSARPAPLRQVGALSFLWWSEHCVECAAPDCYASCSLYERRNDGGCRRLVWGCAPDRRFPSLRGFGIDVAFKTWGKLESDANPVMEPAGRVLWRERLAAAGPRTWAVVDRLAPALTRDPAGGRLPADGRRIAKKLMRRRLDRGGGAGFGGGPEAFVIEVFNPGSSAVALQLAIRVAGKGVASAATAPPPPVLARFVLPPGFSRHRLDGERFQPLLDAGHPCKIAVMPEADAAARLVFLTLDFVAGADLSGLAEPAAVSGPTRPAAPVVPVKCVVFDLDGTLWDGVLIESAAARPLPVRAEMAETIRRLDARGILISVASKNDREPALARLGAAGLADLILHPEIDWGPKSDQIRRIARSLNIGVDSLAFVDDSPFERAEVAAALPAVMVVEPAAAPALLAHPRFSVAVSADGANRRQLYQEEQVRADARTTWGEDYLGFLRTCAIELIIRRYRPEDFDRVAELVQRTNQLNYSGAKYTPRDMAGLIDGSATEPWVLRCRDRFGSYGTVGFVVVRRSDTAINVEEFMLSCRVQGRGIEQAVFATLTGCGRGGDDAVPCRLHVRYRRSDRNGPAAQVLAGLGFAAAADGDGLDVDLARTAFDAGFVRVVTDQSCSPGATATADRPAESAAAEW